MRYRLAILDMNNGVANQGMRCIREIANEFIDRVDWDVYDVRASGEVPDTSYDLYISSGGPGSPLDGDGDWDRRYFQLLEDLWKHNQDPGTARRKYVFFICHSYQMACRFFEIANVCSRIKRSFGVLPVYPTQEGRLDPVLDPLPDPFYAVDVRDFQVIEPDEARLAELGAAVLAIEQPREVPGQPRAVMSVRFSDEFFGTQFHPEADADGMLRYYQLPEKKRDTIATYGKERYMEIIRHLKDPDKVELTRDTVIPGFIRNALYALDLQS
jgi:homoserine O-succinyltransferase